MTSLARAQVGAIRRRLNIDMRPRIPRVEVQGKAGETGPAGATETLLFVRAAIEPSRPLGRPGPLGVRRPAFAALPLVLAVEPFSPGGALQELAADAAVFLLVGGLAVLSLVVSLVVLQNFVPARGVASANGRTAAGPRELRPLGDAPTAPPSSARRTGRATGDATKPRIDYTLDQLVRLRLGEPRILRHQPRYTHLRLYGCRSCDPHAPASGGDVRRGCSFESGQILTAFQSYYRQSVLVRETACRGFGAPACEFEVRH